jgi:hypothetical protein
MFSNNMPEVIRTKAFFMMAILVPILYFLFLKKEDWVDVLQLKLHQQEYITNIVFLNLALITFNFNIPDT